MLDIPKAASRLRQMARGGMSAVSRQVGHVPQQHPAETPDPTIVRLPEGKPVTSPGARPGARGRQGASAFDVVGKPKLNVGRSFFALSC